MNNGVFDGSSKMCADPSTKSYHNDDDVEMGHGGPGPYRIQESNEEKLIESRYTWEKATTEAISNEIVAESPVHQAMQDHGREPFLDVASEIQEFRRFLMALHQGLLGITSPVVAVTLAEERPIEGGPPSPILDTFSTPVRGLPVVEKRTGPKGLKDYKKDCEDHAELIIGGIIGIFLGAFVMLLIVNSYLEYRFNGKGM